VTGIAVGNTASNTDSIEHIVFILDQSGSMAIMGDEPWQGYNKWLKDLKKENPDALLTTIFFNDDVEIIQQNTKVASSRELRKRDYNPDNMTALYDAVGYGIDHILQNARGTDTAFLAVLTDGEENSSRRYNRKSYESLIKEFQRREDFDIFFLSSDPLALQDARFSGVSTMDSHAVAASPAGFNSGYTTLTQSYTTRSNRIRQSHAQQTK